MLVPKCSNCGWMAISMPYNVRPLKVEELPWSCINPICESKGTLIEPIMTSVPEQSLTTEYWGNPTTNKSCFVCGLAQADDEHINCCIAKLRGERRGFRIMVKKMYEMVPREFQTIAISEGKYERAGGDAECQVCKIKLSEHPEVPGFPTFHQICDHSVVKL